MWFIIKWEWSCWMCGIRKHVKGSKLYNRMLHVQHNKMFMNLVLTFPVSHLKAHSPWCKCKTSTRAPGGVNVAWASLVQTGIWKTLISLNESSHYEGTMTSYDDTFLETRTSQAIDWFSQTLHQLNCKCGDITSSLSQFVAQFHLLTFWQLDEDINETDCCNYAHYLHYSS